MNDPLGIGGFVAGPLTRPASRTTTTKKKQKDFLTDQISTGGGIGGALAGAAGGAAIGSVVPVIGTAAGGIIGALLGGGLGSAAGEVGENAITGDELSKNVLQEGLIGGVTSLPLGAGFKLARAGTQAATGLGKKTAGELIQEAGLETIGKKRVAKMAANGTLDENAAETFARLSAPKGGRLGRTLENTGNKMLNSQSTISGAQARQAGILPAKAFGNINARTGLTNLDDMAEVGRGLTGAGEDSLLDTVTRAAVDNTTGVDIGDLNSLATKLLDDKGTLLTDSQRKQLISNVKNAAVTMRGGSKGSLSPLANPSEALNQANKFRAAAQTIRNKSLTATPEQTDLANVYSGLADHIEEALHTAPGINDSIPTLAKAGADDLLFRAQDLRQAGNTAQAKAYEAVAKELRGATTLKDVRSLKKDWVDISKIDRATATAEGARALGGADMTKSLRNPLNVIGMALDSATPKAGGAVASLGRKVAGSGEPRGVGQSLVGTTARQVGGRGIIGALNSPSEQPLTGFVDGLEPGSGTTDQTTVEEPSVGGYTKSQIENAMAAAATQGDAKALSALKSLYELLPSGSSGGFNATTSKALSQSANADNTLTQLEGLLSNAGGAQGPIGGALAGFAGDIGINNNAKAFNDLANGSVAQIARALGETGALSDSDKKAYFMLLPKISDTPEVVRTKFAALRQRMAAAHANTLMYGGGASPEDIAAGY